MASLGTLTVDLVAQVGGFVRGMDKAERASGKWRRSVQKDLAKVGRAMSNTLKVGTVAAAAGLAVVVQRSREAIDEQAKLAQQLNTSSESLANLRRAGELSGVAFKQITTAGRQLDVALAKAAQGEKTYAEAVEMLGLNVEELISLPLDQRLNAVNRALLENVAETERAAVAADLFGTRNGAAIRQLQPDVIAQASEEVALFGLNLSDVDAAKVELANDAFSTMKVAASGVGQQLTVALAPAIRAVGVGFLETAEDAGGMGNLVTDSVGSVIKALASVMNVADGVKRSFQLAGRAITISILGWKGVFLQAAVEILAAYNKLPFTQRDEEVASLNAAIKLNNEAIRQGGEDIQRILTTPLSGNQLKTAFEEAKREAQAAAEAAVAAREGRRISASGVETAPLASELEAEKAADEKAERAAEKAEKARQREEDAERRHQEKLAAIAAAGVAAREQAVDQGLSSILNTTRQFAGEQSTLYQGVFAVEKGVAIARSIVAIQTAIAQAAASGPFPANLAAMATIAGQTAGIISTIMSTGIQGQAHDGMMSVPKTGSYILEQGERVMPAETTAKLDSMLEGIRQGGMGSGVRIVNAFDTSDLTDFMGSSEGEKVIMNVVRRNQKSIRTLSSV